jgi:hypothetical protein
MDAGGGDMESSTGVAHSELQHTSMHLSWTAEGEGAEIEAAPEATQYVVHRLAIKKLYKPSHRQEARSLLRNSLAVDAVGASSRPGQATPSGRLVQDVWGAVIDIAQSLAPGHGAAPSHIVCSVDAQAGADQLPSPCRVQPSSACTATARVA